MFKILSWNIRQGGGTRYQLISKYLLESKADVIVLSEYQNNDRGNAIRQALLSGKYFFQSVSTIQTGKNAVLICSKHPFHSTCYAGSGYDYNEGVLKICFDAFNLFGVYLPHKKKHKLFDLLLKEIDADLPSIIAGDFNTGKNYIDQKGDSFWYTEELDQLEKKNMVDAFRFFNKDIKEYSWFSHQGNGYRYDHFYVSDPLISICKSCYYDHQCRIEKYSDHSPMFLELA